MKNQFDLLPFILNSHRMYDGYTDENQANEPPGRFSLVEVEIVNIKNSQRMCILERVPSSTSIAELKDMFEKKFQNYYPSRQSFRMDKRSNILRDSDTLVNLNLSNECTLYFDDLGSQIGWRTVFLAQYFPPIVIYLIFYLNIPYSYFWSDFNYLEDKTRHSDPEASEACFFACICYVGHFTRQIFEVLFVHRFNNFTTMKATRTTKNCIFYWGTTVLLAYFINHPNYQTPSYGPTQVYCAFTIFWILQIAILSVHYTYRAQKPPVDRSSGMLGIGSRDDDKHQALSLIPGESKYISKIKRQTHQTPFYYNIFTWPVNHLVCPNYTYEMLSWFTFAILTQCFLVFIYAILVTIQMVIWARQKRRNYILEFRDYPKNRYCMIPFLV